MSHRPLAARGLLMSLFLAATFGTLTPVMTEHGPILARPRKSRNPKLNFSPRMNRSTTHARHGAKERARRVRQMAAGKCIDPIAQRTYFRATFRPDV